MANANKPGLIRPAGETEYEPITPDAAGLGRAQPLGHQCSWVCHKFILARLLSPADGGFVAMATVSTGLVGMVQDLGVGAALVRLPDITLTRERAAFTIVFATSVVLPRPAPASPPAVEMAAECGGTTPPGIAPRRRRHTSPRDDEWSVAARRYFSAESMRMVSAP